MSKLNEAGGLEQEFVWTDLSEAYQKQNSIDHNCNHENKQKYNTSEHPWNSMGNYQGHLWMITAFYSSTSLIRCMSEDGKVSGQ